MYKEYLKIQSSKNGTGLYTTVKIPADLPIIEATGDVMTIKQLLNPNDPVLLQVGPNTYMCETGKFVPDNINHSCDPNCYFHIVGNRAILYSLYIIPAGSELTFDYSTTSTESMDSWKMNCNCKSFKCRGVISGFQYLDTKLQDEYKTKNILPLYITHSMIQKR